MNNIEEELPEDQDQSAIIKTDAKFENSSVDPGFVYESVEEDRNNGSEKEKDTEPSDEKEKHDSGKSTSGLGDLDGTNPGSNYHPMDDQT